MSEAEQNANSEVGTESFVDAVLGGKDPGATAPGTKGHSPAEAEDAQDVTADDDGNLPIPDDEDADDGFPSEDSTGEENAAPDENANAGQPGADVSRLQEEISGLRKRLHDTQAAMHKATGERAALQKELDELKKKQDSDDDWFSETDKSRTEQIEQDLKKSDAEIERVQQEEQELSRQTAVAEWDAAAAPVIKAHPDFEKVVYTDLVPLLDPKTGNPQIRAQWKAMEDKSPAATYEFAKKALDILDFQRDPQAYKERLRKEFKQHGGTAHGEDAPVGKEGLDMTPSADMPDAIPERRNMSFVDAVFGK